MTPFLLLFISHLNFSKPAPSCYRPIILAISGNLQKYQQSFIPDCRCKGFALFVELHLETDRQSHEHGSFV